MFCNKCGAEIPETAKFCPKCGASFGGEAVNGAVDPVGTGTVTGTDTVKKSFPIVQIIAGLVAILLIVLGITLVLKLKKTTINLNDYVTVDYEGYDGYGTASAEFDSDKFIADYKTKIKPDKSIKKLLKEDDDFKREIERGDYSFKKGRDICELFVALYTNGKGELTAGGEDITKLHNGDTVTYKWDFSTDDMSSEEAVELAKKAFNVKIVAEDKDFTVEDLDLIDLFDPFAEIEVEFTGIAPNGRAEIKDYPNNGLYYRIDTTDGLKNGDTVTVTVDYDWYSEEEYAMQYKRLPKEMSKTYTVEGLASYVGSASDIPDDMLNKMKKEAEDKIASQAASNWNDEVKLAGSEYIGNYFLMSKDSGTWSDVNRLILVYKVSANISLPDDDYEGTAEFYYTVKFSDIMTMEDGTCSVDLSRYEVTYNSFGFETTVKSWGSFKKYYFYGYENIDSMFSEEVTRVIDRYNYENNVSEN